MKGFSPTFLKRIMSIVFLGSILAMPVQSLACGLNWSEPRSHFQGVSYQGYVFLVKNLGEIRGDANLLLPLRVVFRSESNITSSHVGTGWEIPLLESHIIQLDERWFRVTEPTGWYRLFWRDEEKPTILHGQNGWKGEIRANQISIWAECGDKIVFNRGKISQCQIGNNTINYVYSEGILSKITLNERTILIVSRKGDACYIKASGSSDIEIKLGERPHVVNTDGSNLVSGITKSLQEIKRTGEVFISVDYGMDSDLNPAMTYEGRKLVWSAANRRIISDGKWRYRVGDLKKPTDYVEISRTSANLEKESWFRDATNGRETTVSKDGIKTVKTWFISGRLAGKPRQHFSTTSTGLVLTEQIYNYRENGKLRRLVSRNQTEEKTIEKGEDGTVKVQINDSQKVLNRVYDSTGILKSQWISIK